MTDILVVGSLNTDLVVRVPRFPQPGETISGEDLQVIPSGKGANQAVAALQVYMIHTEPEWSLLESVTETDIPSAVKGAQVLLQRGAKHVIVTLGSKGALIVDKETSTQVDTFKVNVVDTTAAGDAFIG